MNRSVSTDILTHDVHKRVDVRVKCAVGLRMILSDCGVGGDPQ